MEYPTAKQKYQTFIIELITEKMKTATMKNIITGVERKVHLTMNHPAVQCGIAVWVDDEGKAYFPEDVQNPFYELKDIKEE